MMWNFFYSFICTMGFCIIFNIRGKNIIFASLGGGIGWVMYLYMNQVQDSMIFSYFLASVVIGIYGEIMARLLKAPVTTFVICAIIPLVPGGGMYYTMLESVQGNFTLSLEKCFETLFIAGAIAVAIILVSSITKLIVLASNSHRRSLKKHA